MNPLINLDSSTNRGPDDTFVVPQNFEELKKINCLEIIQKTSKDIKGMLYNANKLMTNENNHIIIDRNERVNIEILEGTN
jgi:hypothetical protein